jgi:hypothetical protein
VSALRPWLRALRGAENLTAYNESVKRYARRQGHLTLPPELIAQAIAEGYLSAYYLDTYVDTRTGMAWLAEEEIKLPGEDRSADGWYDGSLGPHPLDQGGTYSNTVGEPLTQAHLQAWIDDIDRWKREPAPARYVAFDPAPLPGWLPPLGWSQLPEVPAPASDPRLDTTALLETARRIAEQLRDEAQDDDQFHLRFWRSLL